MTQKVIKTGNSLAVTIPSFFVKICGVKPSDEVRVKVETQKGKITYYFSTIKQLPLSENFLKTKLKKK